MPIKNFVVFDFLIDYTIAYSMLQNSKLKSKRILDIKFGGKTTR